MGYYGPGVNIEDPNISFGLMARRRNPKRKSRLPYHAKRRFDLQIVTNKSTCRHALAKHEEIRDALGRAVVVSYAVQCNVSHKATTKSPTHKDNLKRSWK